MIALALATILTGAFAVIVRLGQKRGGDLCTIGVVNYVTASLVFVPLLRLHPPPIVSHHTLVLGAIGGLVYATAYYLFLPVMSSRGVAIGSAITRVSVVLPMLLSLVVWREVPTWVQAIGAALALAALPLLATSRLDGGPSPPRSREFALLAALFLFNGGCLSVAKWYHVTGNLAERPAYFTALFGVAALYAGAVWAIRSQRRDALDVLIGVLLGLTNASSNFALLSALDAFPGVVTFPATAAGGLVLAVAFAAIWWKELPTRLGALGVLLAVLAVVLVNL